MTTQNDKINTMIETTVMNNDKIETTNQLTERGSRMSGIDFRKIAVCKFTHKFTGEKCTAVRTNRCDHDPFVIAMIVHYPSGDWGIGRMYSKKREKAMQREYRRFVRQTETLQPGFDHMLGAIVELLPVECNLTEFEQETKKPKIVETVETTETAETVETTDHNDVLMFASRSKARAACREFGIPQSRIAKDQSGKWIVDTAQA